jgi:hypothetical protein
MRAIDLTLKLLGLADVICKWQAMMARLDKSRRIKIARYALRIAASLARMASALERLETDATDRAARRGALREVGRLAGYMETIVTALRGHVDGRRLAGVERRLQSLAVDDIVSDAPTSARLGHIERVVAAEGYMRALADSLRT